MTVTQATITIRFLDWWHAGTGHSGAGDVDMVAYRDRAGCPAMPMTQIKGILRETAEEMKLMPRDEINRFFGERSEPGVTVNADGAAVAFTGEAALTADEQAWFHANPKAQGMLFGWLRSTAIDEDTGAAKGETLRSIEACVPVTLSKTIEWIGPGECPGDWLDQLDLLCAMTPAFGKMTNDGLGRAIASCGPVAGAKP